MHRAFSEQLPIAIFSNYKIELSCFAIRAEIMFRCVMIRDIAGCKIYSADISCYNLLTTRNVVTLCSKDLSTNILTHWGQVTHICVGKLTIIGSDNGLSPERRQAIIKTNAWILSIWSLGTNFSEILIEIQTFSLKKIRLKMSSAKCCSFRLGLNVLIHSQDALSNVSKTQTGILLPVPATETEYHKHCQQRRRRGTRHT